MAMVKRRRKKKTATQIQQKPVQLALRLRPELVFAILSLSAGLFMAFATGPYHAPDEGNHFMRAFQLSQGQVLPTLVRHDDGSVDAGAVLPVCLRETSEIFMRIKGKPSEKVSPVDWKEIIKRPFAPKPEAFTGFHNTLLYPPISYIPQVVGIWLTRPLGVSTLVMMYAGRVLNLLCWATLVFFAIRLMPVQKWVVALIGLMPMSAFIAASLSSDPMTNGMSMLFVATVAQACLGEQDGITLYKKIGMVLLSMGIAVAKIVYCPLIALVLLIPGERLGGLKRKIIFCMTVVGCAAITAAAWSYCIKGALVTRGSIDVPAQASFVLHNPVTFLLVVIDTINNDWIRYSLELVGVLGWLDTILPSWIYLSYPAITILVATISGSDARKLSTKGRVMLLAVCLISVLLVETSLFITWTKPGARIISGVQGRYFIPLLVPLFLILHDSWAKGPEKWLGPMVTVYSAGVLATTCVVIGGRYYW